MENKKLNEIYERPLAELIDIRLEGVLCSSGTGEDMDTNRDGYDDM